MRIIFSLLAILFFVSLLTQNVLADDYEEEEQVRHYEVEMPNNREGAISLLETSLESIKKAIEDNDMHMVHEISYSSEAAIKSLQKLTSDTSLVEKLQVLWEINEEMHEASEADEVDAAKVLSEFHKLTSSWKNLGQYFH